MIAPSNARRAWVTLLVTGNTGGPLRSPGVVVLSSNDEKFGWDIQNATGVSGAITRRINEPLKEFDADFYITDEQGPDGRTDFDDWDAFQKLLESSAARKTPYPLTIVHPDLARNHITAATVGSIGGIVLDGKGGGTIKVHFLEYRPPKPNRPVSLTRTPGDALIEGDIATIGSLKTDLANAWKAPSK